MATITPKENYLRLSRGEMPEYVPIWTMGGIWPPTGRRTPLNPTMGAGAPIWPMNNRDANGNLLNEWKSVWGVPYVANAETNWQALPKPNDFILDDITKWASVIKKPDVGDADSFDWEALSAASLANIDRANVAVSSGAGTGPFQLLMGMMGFTEGLIALVEEPEACEEFFAFITDYYEPYIVKTMDYFKPDIVSLGDDTASKYNPFFSVETFKRLFKPVYMSYGRLARERGLPIQFHNCGRCEDFLDDYVEIGVKYWDPAQTTNDILGIKEKYKGRVNVVGCFDFVPGIDYNQVSEEYMRSFVRETIDKYAKDGGYAFIGGYLGRADELDRAAVINDWITDEAEKYGATFYNK